MDPDLVIEPVRENDLALPESCSLSSQPPHFLQYFLLPLATLTPLQSALPNVPCTVSIYFAYCLPLPIEHKLHEDTELFSWFCTVSPMLKTLLGMK